MPAAILNKQNILFQAVDQFQSALVPDHRGPCEVEGKHEVLAVRARERSFDLAGKHFPTGLAKRLGQPGHAFITGAAQRISVLQVHPTNFA